jgi:hypothetical protein
MAIIYDTTMTPGKLELLASWLPAQPWYLDTGRAPRLTKAGGFRLDDPQGEVGIEFMVVTDEDGGPGGQAVAYQVPMTYRSRVLAGAEGGLIGTAEHGVLGPRWIYDGAHDLVLVAQLVAALQGHAEPQAQNVSHTADPSVIARPGPGGPWVATGHSIAADEQSGTELLVETAAADGAGACQLTIRINRTLQPGDSAAQSGGTGADAGQPCLSATWKLPADTRAHGIFATARCT